MGDIINEDTFVEETSSEQPDDLGSKTSSIMHRGVYTPTKYPSLKVEGSTLEIVPDELDENKMLDSIVPENWEPFSSMPEAAEPPAQLPNFDLFPSDWTDTSEEKSPKWACLLFFVLGLMLLWHAHLSEI